MDGVAHACEMDATSDGYTRACEIRVPDGVADGLAAELSVWGFKGRDGERANVPRYRAGRSQRVEHGRTGTLEVMALKTRSAAVRGLKVLLTALWNDRTCSIAAKRWRLIQQNQVDAEEGRQAGDVRKFCPVETTVLIIGPVLLAVLWSFARGGIQVWRRLWVF